MIPSPTPPCAPPRHPYGSSAPALLPAASSPSPPSPRGEGGTADLPALEALARPLHFLVVFAGADEAPETLVRYLRRRGARVTAVDTKLGGRAHDVLYGNLGHELEMRIRALEFDGVFLAPPCSSYSVRHWPRLRSLALPDGVDPMPPEWRAYVRKHNLLTALSATLFGASCEAGVPVGLENPSDRSDRDSFAY